MLAIGGIETSAVTARSSHRGPAACEADAPASEGRALIPVAAPAPGGRSGIRTRCPLAGFLAHLIATQTQAPQTRARRRAEPEEALALYGIALIRPAKVGRKFARDA